MSENTPVTLKITFTPQGPDPVASDQAVRDWVAHEVENLTPVFVTHRAEEGQLVSTAYDITAVDLAEK